MNTWWMSYRTFYREVLILVTLTTAIGMSVAHLFTNAVPVLLVSRDGIIPFLNSNINAVFGTSGEPIMVLPVGLFVGLVLVLSFDHYKYMYGYILTGGTVLSFLVLVQQPGIADPTQWDWRINLPFLLLGLCLGVLVAGLRWEGRFPIRPTTFTHDYMRQRRRPGTQYEFRRALPRLLLLVGGILLFVLFERIVDYRLIPPRVTDVHLTGVGGTVLSVLVIIGTLYFVREYSADMNTVLIGATGTGKTTMMAGLSYTTTAEDAEITNADPSPALLTLESVLKERGFKGILSTAADETVPVQLTFKHGLLFPKRVTLTSIDYAGEHITGGGRERGLQVPRPHEGEDEVVTDDFEQAFKIAQHIRWLKDRGSRGTTFIDVPESPGVDPTAEDFDWPDWVRTGGELSDERVILQILQDMLYYADSIVLLLPMDDFGDYALDSGYRPSWAVPKEGEVGSLESVRGRDEYLPVFKRIYQRLGLGTYTHDGEEYEGKGSDVFYAFTMADVAIPAFKAEREEVAQPAADRPKAFSEYILDNFVPEDVKGQLSGLFGRGSSRKSEPDNARPVNFDTRPSSGDEETPVELVKPDEPRLYGTRYLLERIGREWR